MAMLNCMLKMAIGELAFMATLKILCTFFFLTNLFMACV